MRRMDPAMENMSTHDGSRIVVGVDGSPASVLALKWAQTLAPALNATITAVTAWHMETAFGSYIVPEWNPEEGARQILQKAAQDAFGDEHPEGFSGVPVQGTPAKVLKEESKSARILIVGSRGHGGFAGMLLGSVSSAISEHASCPVLVLHGGKDAMGVAVSVGAGREAGDDPVHNT